MCYAFHVSMSRHGSWRTVCVSQTNTDRVVSHLLVPSGFAAHLTLQLSVVIWNAIACCEDKRLPPRFMNETIQGKVSNHLRRFKWQRPSCVWLGVMLRSLVHFGYLGYMCVFVILSCRIYLNYEVS